MGGGFHLVRRSAAILLITAISLLPTSLSTTDAEALLQFKESLKKTEPLSTWASGTTPCGDGPEWTGVMCSNGNVTALRLDSMGLEGRIDIDALTKVPTLLRVSFENNAFEGSIPAFNRMPRLRSVFISRNNFSGKIPGDYFVSMKSLRKIGVADNQFSGDMPWSLARVPNLVQIAFENNFFTGRIPDMGQKSLSMVNVSNNHLFGEIPRTLSRFDATSFAGNDKLCGQSVEKACAPGEGSELRNKMQMERQKAIDELIENVIMVGAGVLMTLVFVALMLIKSEERRERYFRDSGRATNRAKDSFSSTSYRGLESGKQSGDGKETDLVVVNDERGVFGMAHLMKAGAESLEGSDGGFGLSYKAMMATGLTVVVKRMRDCNRVEREGFEAEMRRLGRVKHPNLLTPLAYHYRRDEKLLISEFVANGSLHFLLHGDPQLRRELSWAIRLIIIKGIARGLAYLHSVFPEAALPHGNLKSSNVLLNSNFEPLLSEFGLDPVVSPKQAGKLLFAYQAPEAAKRKIVTPKCDVFCLGILIHEILTAKLPSLSDGARGVDVVEWVEACISQGRTAEAFDPDLMANVPAASRLEMEKLLHIAADCTERNPDMRLAMDEAVPRIEQIQIGAQDENYHPHHALSIESLSIGSLSTSFTSFHTQSPGCDPTGRAKPSRHCSQSDRFTSFHTQSPGCDPTGRAKPSRHCSQSDRLSCGSEVLDSFREASVSHGQGNSSDLSRILKQDGYSTGQGTKHNIMHHKTAVITGRTHHNFYGLLSELDK